MNKKQEKRHSELQARASAVSISLGSTIACKVEGLESKEIEDRLDRFEEKITEAEAALAVSRTHMEDDEPTHGEKQHARKAAAREARQAKDKAAGILSPTGNPAPSEEPSPASSREPTEDLMAAELGGEA